MLLAGKRLNGKQKQQFREALDAAFDYDSLEQMLNDNFDKKVTDIIVPIHVNFPTILDEVLKKSERESWTAQLLQAVLSMRPEDMQLITFARQFGPLLITPPLKELVAYRGFERAVTSAAMHDYDRFLQGLWERGSQVCRIEVDGKHMGTGFLVGPDMVMTCYHVWEMVQYPDKCICWFDHGSTSAKPYYLAQNSKIDVSKHNPEEGLPNGRASTPDELDYALLQLKDTPGNEPVLRLFQDKPSQRGWITPYAQEYTFPPDSPLYILHYPQLSSSEGSHKPLPVTLKLSQEEHAIIENDGIRVKYTTNTESGSSGAPCFNASWELVAMHHFGDPHEPPQYNQGIPFSAIIKLLGARGKLNALGASPDTKTKSQHSKDRGNTQEPIDLESRREKQESDQLLSYEMACKYFHEAAAHLQNAHEPLKEELYIPSAVFSASIQNLQEMHLLVHKVIECLQNSSSLPTNIAKEVLDIIHSLRMVEIHIKQSLLPNLFLRKRENFEPLIRLMHTIEIKLLPDHKTSLTRDITIE